MSSGASSSGSNKPGKRKRSASDLEDIENVCEPMRATEKYDHRRKRVRESPPTSPPLTPLTPHNMTAPDLTPCDSPDVSNTFRWSSCSISDSRTRLTSPVLLNTKCEIIDLMGQVDSRSDVSADYISRHPLLQSRMRAVLLDWLMEVCEAYKMHRATYYLAINYLDRYLSKTKGILKTQLQLIGITCLFIAAKVEEIYPPKATEFSYVTNEACSLEEILQEELVILSKLEWNINALTVHGWFSFLLQLVHNKEPQSTKVVLIANHPVKEYLMTAQLIDLAMMDEMSLKYPYLPLAAAAIHLVTHHKDILSRLPVKMSNEDRELMMECVSWLKPYADHVKSAEASSPRKSLPADYTLQSHTGDLKLLDTIQDRIKELRYSSVIMTPPNSSEKH